jgi:hypothetical protein
MLFVVHSWEWGAQSQVLLEMQYQELSVYATGRKLPLSQDDGPIQMPQSMLDLIDPILARRDPNTLPLVEGDGSAGDPASLGIAVLVASAATSNGNQSPLLPASLSSSDSDSYGNFRF